jgi:hypothetical protein
MDETAAKDEIEYTFLFMVDLQPATTATIVRCKTSNLLRLVNVVPISDGSPHQLVKSEFHYNYKRRKRKV